MRLEPTGEQQLMIDMFARFLDEHSSIERVRAALPRGFDADLWRGLAGQGAFAIRLPEAVGGLALGLFDACLLMEQAGRTLVSGPLAEAIAATGLLARLDPADAGGLLAAALAGDAVVTLALEDIAVQPSQLVAGGALAHAVLARDGDRVLLVAPGAARDEAAPTLAATSLARVDLARGEHTVLGSGAQAVAHWAAAVEEWKLLVSAALYGLAKEALRCAAQYACEREQFGRPIGTYQAVSHPLAEARVEVDAGRLLLWRALRAVADAAGAEETDPHHDPHNAPHNDPHNDSQDNAGARISDAAWWACTAAQKAVDCALHTFGGYGLTLEYDIHLYNLHAKALPLVLGDPERLLDEAARRRYAAEPAALPDVGPVPIDFDPGDDARALAAELDAFFTDRLTPRLRARAHYSFAGHDADLHRQLAQAGLLFPAWPRHMGGRAASACAMHAALDVWHEHGWTTHAQATDNIVGYVMDRFGTPTLKSEALARVAAGEACCALGFSEPGSGSDVFAARTRATREGDEWRIDGQKMFTSGAEIADYVLLLARTDPDAPKHRGLTMFIVPLDAPGVTVQPVHTFQDERTNVTFYDAVRVPDSYRLGEEGDGLRVLVASLEIEHAMTFVKEHARLLRAARRLCRDTSRDGRKRGDDPAVQRVLARGAVRVSASEVLNFRALWAADGGAADAAVGPASKMFSSEVYRADACDLLNLTAPESLANTSRDAAYINWCYRHSQVATVYGGTSEIHLSMVAERVLGLPRTRD